MNANEKESKTQKKKGKKTNNKKEKKRKTKTENAWLKMEKRTRRPSRPLVVLLLVWVGFMAMLSGALGDIEPLTELEYA